MLSLAPDDMRMDDDPRPHPSSFAPLSPRERDILALLAQDLSDREIAERLVVAYTTVKWHNRQIFNKLGVENRQQAVERAFDLGVLKQAEPSPLVDHNLPAQLTPFVGRLRELDDLIRLLNHPNTRLVTILAPGGMGKTRLSLAAAENALRYFPDGVYFVPLAPLTAPDQLVPTIADAIGLRFVPDSRPPKQQMLDALRAKIGLLILDNFEHLLEGAALVTDMLQSAPQVKILATSRERLNLDGETVYRLNGLPYPEQDGEQNVLDYGAVQLFVECACRSNPHLTVQAEASVVRVCQLVQGMPLALELGAAWVGMLSVDEIADEIARSADFLSTTKRNVPERLRSLRAVFEATWHRLSDGERQVFRRLSVFRGGCTREAAQIVAGADLTTLAGLVNKALLWRRADDGRYEIHELLRQYAAEQLEAAFEAEATRNLHRDYFGKLAQDWGKALKTPQQLQALDVLEGDYDNIRAAFQCAIATGKPEVMEPFTELWYFYEIRSGYSEAVTIFGSAINQLEGRDSLALGKLLAAQSLFISRYFQWEQARSVAEASIDMLRRVGAVDETPFPMMVYASAIGSLGDPDGEDTVVREALTLAQRSGDQWAVSLLTYLQGYSALYVHQRFDEARRYLLQAHALVTALGNVWGLCFTIRDLAYLAYEAGNNDEAKRLYEEVLATARQLHHVNVIDVLHGLRLIAMEGDLLGAKEYCEQGLKIAHYLGHNIRLFEFTTALAEIAVALADYQDARERLREMLRLFAVLNDPNYGLDIALAAAPYLAHLEARAESAMLIGFINHHPQRPLLLRYHQEVLRTLTARMQSELRPDLYSAAWDRGQAVTVDELITVLHSLI